MNTINLMATILSASAGAEEATSAVPKVEVTGLFRLADQIVDAWLGFLDWVGRLFEPIMKPIFHPINVFLANAYMPWAKICALGLFLGAMAWVCFGMHEDYVNSGRTKKSIWTDLRVWTVISMLPHVFVYLYF